MKLIFVNTYMNPQLIDWMYTTSSIMDKLPYRLNSNVEYGIPIYHVYPEKSIMPLLRSSLFGDSNTLDFDKAYYNQLFSNTESYKDLMKALVNIQDRDNTFILVNYHEDYEIFIIDSLIKAIQVRYSINSHIISDIEDTMDLEDTPFETQSGYSTYISDCERYSLLIKDIHISDEEISIQKQVDDDRSVIEDLSRENQINELSAYKSIY